MKLLALLMCVSVQAQKRSPSIPLPITAVAFHPGGKMLAQGGYQEVLLWDLANAKLARRLGAGQLSSQVRALAFAKDGRSLTVADGVFARTLDFETGQVTATSEPSKDEIFSLAFSSDGKFLAAGGADRLVRVWSGGQVREAPVVTLKDHSDWVTGVAFSPDGKFLASSSIDKTVEVWEAGTWKPVVKLPQALTESVHGLAFSADGAFLAFAVGGDGERAIRIWRTASAEEQQQTDSSRPRRRDLVRQTRALDTGGGMPLGVAWAARANRLYVPGTDHTVKLLGPSGAVLASLRGHSDWVYTVALSPDGTRIATGSADGTVKLWSGANGSLLATLVQLAPRTDQALVITPSPVQRKKGAP